jgi:betaine reductase
VKRIAEFFPQRREGAKFGKLTNGFFFVRIFSTLRLGAFAGAYPNRLNGGRMQKGKKVIAIGERDGVPGPVIAECLEGAGYEVVFQVTECFV